MYWLICFIIIVLIYKKLSLPKSCNICNVRFKKGYYPWTIYGKNQKLCPKCNNRMENKLSKEAFNDKFG